MGSFTLSSESLFLRSAGKDRVMVVKFKKDVHSTVAETKDWEVVEIVGKHTSYESLEIFGRTIKGEILKKIASNLCESRLWVNMEGKSFIRLSITSLSLRVVFYRSNELFHWEKYGVKKPYTFPNTSATDTESDDEDKTPEELKQELKEYKKKLKDKAKEAEKKDEDHSNEIKKLLKDKAKEEEKKDENHSNEIKKLLKDKTKEAEKKEEEHKTEIKKLKTELHTSKENYKTKEKEFETQKKTITDLKASIGKKDTEITNLKGKINSSSSSSSSTNSLAVTQYDQILHKNRRPVLSIRFTVTSYNSSLYYSPDFTTMPTYRAVDEVVMNRYPSNINVYVGNNVFQREHWWFTKIRDENSSYQSLFAFYGGVNDSSTTNTTTYGRNIHVKIPYTNGVQLRSNVRFLAVALRGYGTAFGFCY